MCDSKEPVMRRQCRHFTIFHVEGGKKRKGFRFNVTRQEFKHNRAYCLPKKSTKCMKTKGRKMEYKI